MKSLAGSRRVRTAVRITRRKTRLRIYFSASRAGTGCAFKLSRVHTFTADSNSTYVSFAFREDNRRFLPLTMRRWLMQWKPAQRCGSFTNAQVGQTIPTSWTLDTAN